MFGQLSIRAGDRTESELHEQSRGTCRLKLENLPVAISRDPGYRLAVYVELI